MKWLSPQDNVELMAACRTAARTAMVTERPQTMLVANQHRAVLAAMTMLQLFPYVTISFSWWEAGAREPRTLPEVSRDTLLANVFICPVCERVSFNDRDLEERYCAACHCSYETTWYEDHRISTPTTAAKHHGYTPGSEHKIGHYTYRVLEPKLAPDGQLHENIIWLHALSTPFAFPFPVATLLDPAFKNDLPAQFDGMIADAYTTMKANRAAWDKFDP